MLIRFLVPFLILLFLTSCQSGDHKSTTSTTTEPESEDIILTTPPSDPAADYQQFQCLTGSGVLEGGLEVFMQLVKVKEWIGGYYYYKKQGLEIDLRGTIDRQGNLSIEELDEEGTPSARFSGTLLENTLSIAQWDQNDRSLSVELTLSEGEHATTEFFGPFCIIQRTLEHETEAEGESELRNRIEVTYSQVFGAQASPKLNKYNQTGRSRAIAAYKDFQVRNMTNAPQDASEVWNYQYNFNVEGADDQWIYGTVSQWDCALDDRSCPTNSQTHSYSLKEQAFKSIQELVATPEQFQQSIREIAPSQIQSLLLEEGIELEATVIDDLLDSEAQYNLCTQGILLRLPGYPLYGYGKDQLLFSLFLPQEKLQGLKPLQ